MSFAAIKPEIETSLLRVKERLGDAEYRLAAGSDRNKVEAAGELEFLKQQKRDLEQRLARLDHLPDAAWARLGEWLREESGMLERRVEEWIVSQ